MGSDETSGFHEDLDQAVEALEREVTFHTIRELEANTAWKLIRSHMIEHERVHQAQCCRLPLGEELSRSQGRVDTLGKIFEEIDRIKELPKKEDEKENDE